MVSNTSFAQKQLQFQNNDGNNITIASGTMAFADVAWLETPGAPYLKARHPRRVARNVLGAPNFNSNRVVSQNVCSLGCGGSLIAQFKNNALVNGPGPDLVVFENGAVMEATKVEISKDGKKWIHVGTVEGFTASIDIQQVAAEGDVFHFVRLTDLFTFCEGKYYDGADIDAIAAIHSQAIPQPTSNFYEVGDHRERPKATAEVEVASAKSDMTIFPNPANFDITLDVKLAKCTDISVYIYDQQGRRVQTVMEGVYYKSGEHQIPASLNDFPAGSYYVMLKTMDESIMKKLIRQGNK